LVELGVRPLPPEGREWSGGVAAPEPAGWSAVEMHRFDFDGDGMRDQFIVEPSSGRVGVHTTSGDVVVEDVDLSDSPFVIRGVPDPYVETPPDQTPPAPPPDAVFTVAGDELNRSTMPVAVHDVTGDGFLDLLVANAGATGVVLGQRTTTAQVVDFDEIEARGVGWLSPQLLLKAEDRPDGGGDDLWIPLTPGALFPIWDIDADGAEDFVFTTYGYRSSGIVHYFLGKPCQD
jgi:hypothetical protein